MSDDDHVYTELETQELQDKWELNNHRCGACAEFDPRDDPDLPGDGWGYCLEYRSHTHRKNPCFTERGWKLRESDKMTEKIDLPATKDKTVDEIINEEIQREYLNQQVEILSSRILGLIGAKTVPPHDPDRIYDNLYLLLTETLNKVLAQTSKLDKYPYTWEVFADNIESYLSNYGQAKNE